MVSLNDEKFLLNQNLDKQNSEIYKLNEIINQN